MNQPPATPLVSVIIPAKNEEHIIKSCIDSIKNIEYDQCKIEIIVVDNGSTDKTVLLAKSNGAIVISNPDISIAGLRNLGMEKSNGAILAFLDADMEVSRGWLTEAIPLLEDPNIGAVGGLLNIPHNASWIEIIWDKHVKMRPKHGPTHWLGSGNFIIRKSTLIDVGSWNEDLTTCEDMDLCDRLIVKHKLLHIESASATHHSEIKSIRDLFLKEVWRGRNSFQRVGSSWKNRQALQSFLLPTIHGISMILFILSFIIDIGPKVIFLAGSIIFPILRTMTAFVKFKNLADIPQFFIVWLVYYTARFLAPFSTIKKS
jgi:glycosyltransferase involved in cell wall biosynthesis